MTPNLLLLATLLGISFRPAPRLPASFDGVVGTAVSTGPLQSSRTISAAELKALYPRIFRLERGGTEGRYYYSLDVDTLPAIHPLSAFVRDNHHFLLYLAQHGTQPGFLDLTRDHQNDWPALRAHYYAAHDQDTTFNGLVLGTADRYLRAQGGRLLGTFPSTSVRTVSLDRMMRTAVRFFYPDAITPGGIQAHICVGINGVRDAEDGRDVVIEAFAYSAIFRDLLEPTHRVKQDFNEAARAMNAMDLSADTTTRLSRAQGVMWALMMRSERLRRVLASESATKREYLPLAVTDSAGAP